MKKPNKAEPSNGEMSFYQFALLLGGVEEISEKLESAIYGAGCDDALLSQINGQVCLEFDREAASLHDAVLSAIRAVEDCMDGLKVLCVYPPNAKEIERINAALRVRNEGTSLLRELQES